MNSYVTDTYSVKVLDYISLSIDSKEVYSIKVLNRDYNKNFKGKVIKKVEDNIEVFIEDVTGQTTVKFLIDKDTTIYDNSMLGTLSIEDIAIGDSIYITLDESAEKAVYIVSSV